MWVRSLVVGLGLAGLMVVLPTGDDEPMPWRERLLMFVLLAVLGTVAIAGVQSYELQPTGPIRT